MIGSEHYETIIDALCRVIKTEQAKRPIAQPEIRKKRGGVWTAEARAAQSERIKKLWESKKEPEVQQ